jgi:hypothetical protein
LSKWVFLQDKTHFPKPQENPLIHEVLVQVGSPKRQNPLFKISRKPTSTKPPHPHVAFFGENPFVQEPPPMETTIYLWNTRTFLDGRKRISPWHNTLAHSFVREIFQSTRK